MKIIAIFGNSNSGKTTLANQLEREKMYPAVHCIGHLKAEIERTYNLPPGTLDTQEGKELQPEGMLITLGQLMGDLYHFYQERDPSYSARGLRKILGTLVKSGQTFSLNAIRNHAEVDLLNILDVPKVKIWINGTQEIVRDTDLLQPELYQKMIADREAVLYNPMDGKKIIVIPNL